MTTVLEMEAEITSGVEYGTDRPCQVGRITYRVGVYDYVALTYRLLNPVTAWRLTWVGEKGERAARLPDGVFPSAEMWQALRSPVSSDDNTKGEPPL